MTTSIDVNLDRMEKMMELEKQLQKSGDSIHATKLKELQEKYASQQTYITFCGHFSAGKSSLINYLCGEKLLPSSPIPTSANVVSIRHGEEQALVQRMNESEQQIIAINELDAYCKNGDDIHSVEIHYPATLLQNQLTVLDTPGIDSTDERHMKSTESALHLADVVFYVMDYNHVQSEVNFNFSKRLQEWGKPFYLVINQIDKHRDTQLTFDQYALGVEQAFADWDIQPSGFIYISVKMPDHPYNQLKQLKEMIGNVSARSDELIELNVNNSVMELMDKHIEWYREQLEPTRQELLESMETEQSYEVITDRLKALEKQKVEQEASPERYEQSIKKEIRSLLDNAMITPATTRELAHHFLQSSKPGFKVGLLFSAKKTEAEILDRLQRFHQDFVEKIQAHLEWHLQDLLRKQAENALITTETLSDHISALTIPITPEWLREQIQAGSVFADEYTINYMKAVSSSVKEQYRKGAFQLVDLMVEHLKLKSKEKMERTEVEIEQLASSSEAYVELIALDEKVDAAEEALRKHVPWNKESIALPKLKLLPMVIEGNIPMIDTSKQMIESNAVRIVPSNSGFSKDVLKGRLTNTAQQLTMTKRWIEDLPATKTLVHSMQEKALRLESSQFTIALFGAFSAGKSSFANALLGENVLPVSPNPTTAAINKIVPPNDQFKHGTALVRMKSEERLFEDIQFSLEQLGYTCEGLEESLTIIRSLQPEDISGKGKPHYTFLQAVAVGWQAAKQQLGMQLSVDIEQFKAYAADESKSCFVHSIDLHYTCPFTEAGFILVDTPGADSINARHTGVAFDYIKNADMILFVTYYNHAFSQADRDFLLQLGRVKDAFELDKMFFIVNAADLASSEEELKDVIQHVETNLLEHGIRQPRIYPISSLKGLEAKELKHQEMLEQSGMERFEQEFIQFTSEGLVDFAIGTAELEMRRAVQMLQQRITAAQAGAEASEQAAAEMDQALAHCQQYLAQFQSAELERGLAQEIGELLYYVKQRVSYRFNELFQYAYNPSLFRTERGDLKTALQEASTELWSRINFLCTEEVLATTLRVEKHLNQSVKHVYGQLTVELQKHIDAFNPEPYSVYEYATPIMDSILDHMDIDVKWLQQHYKNAKYFFEGEGKSTLRQKLEQKYTPFIDDCMRHLEEALVAHYVEAWQNQLSVIKHLQEETLRDTIEGIKSAYDSSMDLDDLKERYNRIEQLLASS